MFLRKPNAIPDAESALPGRDQPIEVPDRHTVLGTPLLPPFPEGIEHARRRHGLLLGRRADVLADCRASTRPRSATPAARRRTRPTTRSAPGRTGHTEAVLVAYDPAKISTRADPAAVLGGPRPDPGHAPGQRRGHPVPLGHLLAHAPSSAAARARQGRLRRGAARRRPRRDHHRDRRGRRRSTTPRTTTSSTWKNPGGYCGIGGTGVSCPIGVGVSAS